MTNERDRIPYLLGAQVELQILLHIVSNVRSSHRKQQQTDVVIGLESFFNFQFQFIHRFIESFVRNRLQFREHSSIQSQKMKGRRSSTIQFTHLNRSVPFFLNKLAIGSSDRFAVPNVSG